MAYKTKAKRNNMATQVETQEAVSVEEEEVAVAEEDSVAEEEGIE
jgi:hypothetical protein